MKASLIVKKKRLLKYWVFFCNPGISFLKINYCFIHFLHWNYTFCNFKRVSITLKTILTLVCNLVEPTKLFLFIASHSLYSMVVEHAKLNLIQRANGVFSNFFISRSKKRVNRFVSFPSLVFFFSSQKDSTVLIDCKRKQILCFGFISNQINSKLIDYPIYFTSEYFFMQFLFINFFFKALSLRN